MALAGPDTLHLTSDDECHGEDFRSVAEFSVSAGQEGSFVLACHAATEPRPRQLGHFPQAFSHVGLVNTVCTLERAARATASGPDA